ncbi:MAG: hypothetical protein M1814_004515 [Vezdaea aestivalis]|nr:MAG: hypothetical protein M1814_004515 [Vezdaea aestivalis]
MAAPSRFHQLTEQDEWEISKLLNSLESESKRDNRRAGKPCKKTTFSTSSPNGIRVDSWRWQDWDFKRTDLPIYARGLFTYKAPDGRSEIVVRGYDKFFNTEEVPKTQWRNIEQDTRGPYELSVKENGCIIFISGLSDGTLLVCSKHSTGPRDDAGLSHAVAAEKWIDRQLQQVGKTRRDLAKELRRRNATAVGELCDDTFEEHILPYGEERAGIYLHGMNLNVPTFTTYRSPDVQEFAERWGFRKTDFLVKDSIADVRQFLDAVAESGAYKGEDVEGFVVRCQARDGRDAPWHDWFFKYKFEEPYLLYRQWREVTKSMINGKTPRFKKHRELTEEYLQFAKQQLVANPSLGKEFNANHGIISMREQFVKSKNLTGTELANLDAGKNGQANEVVDGVVLVPIASIGCGKTTLAIALVHLFGWGHIQNDNIQGIKGRPKRFAELVRTELFQHAVVIADRNNHQKRERKQLIEDVQSYPGVKLVAMHWVHQREGESRYQTTTAVRQVTQDRVFKRGDNHQTIRAESKSHAEIQGIMDGFLDRFEPADPFSAPDDGFDSIIDLDPTLSSRENLETLVTQLHALYPALWTVPPTGEALDAAIAAALSDYAPTTKHDLNFRPKVAASQLKPAKNPATPKPSQTQLKSNKPVLIEYFTVRLPTSQILAALEASFAAQPPETRAFYLQLQQLRRIQTEFHVTLLHRAQSSTEEHADEWKRLSGLWSNAIGPQGEATPSDTAKPQDPVLGKCQVNLECMLWSKQVMCIVARLVDTEGKGWKVANEVAHVTIGTAGKDVKPVESNALIRRWLEMGAGEASGVSEIECKGKKVLEGTVGVVLRR